MKGWFGFLISLYMLYRCVYVCVNVRCISLGSLSIYLYTELCVCVCKCQVYLTGQSEYLPVHWAVCVWMSGVSHWAVWVSTCTLSCMYVNVRCISLGSLSIYLYTELCVCECQVYITGQSEYLPVHWAVSWQHQSQNQRSCPCHSQLSPGLLTSSTNLTMHCLLPVLLTWIT